MLSLPDSFSAEFSREPAGGEMCYGPARNFGVFVYLTPGVSQDPFHRAPVAFMRKTGKTGVQYPGSKTDQTRAYVGVYVCLCMCICVHTYVYCVHMHVYT